jgi:hypothetical protein
MNEEIVRQHRAAEFLLGLGLGLIVGIVFQPRDAQARRFVEGSKSSRRVANDQANPES